MMRSWVRSGRHPFQIALLAVSFVSGLAGLVLPGPAPSSGIDRALGDIAPWFYLALLLSAALGLTGAFWRARDVRALQVGMQIERAGMPLLTGASGCYAALVLTVSGGRALVAALLIGGIGLAALVRTRQITADLAYVKALIEEEPGDMARPGDNPTT
jgi:hypothetical protein